MQSTAEAHMDPSSLSQKLLLSIAGALTGTAVVLAGVLMLVNDAQWWRGLFAAAIASTMAAAASALPLLWSFRRGINQRLAGFFIASGLRMVISLAACLIAVRAGGYPAAPTLLLMVVFYFAVLAIEAAFVARSLWNARD